MKLPSMTDFCKSSNLAVIGDIMLDKYLIGTTDRISPEAPVPIVDVIKTKDVVGGAANVMSNAANLGAKVYGFGTIGNDVAGKFVKNRLTKMNVDVKNILVEKKRKTILKCRILSENHQLLRYDIESRDDISKELESKLIDGLEKISNKLQMILISDYNKGVLTPSLIRSILKIAKKNNVTILTDPKIKNAENYRGIDYVKINVHNAEKITNIPYSNSNVKKLCLSLSKFFKSNNVILTRGKEGLLIFSKGVLISVSSFAREVYDVTGAGDVLTSVLGICISNGYDLKSACQIANIAAGISVAKVGTYSLSKKELVNAVDLYDKGVKI